jgi:hypothetical protein
LNSSGGQDGWVLESNETSGLGGSGNSTGLALVVGDDASNKQYRSILSFGTGSLPDNARILSVQLRLKFQRIVGTDPFTTHGNLTVDLNKRPFSGSSVLQKTDFEAAAGMPDAFVIPNTPVAGWYSVTWNSSNFSFIELTGVTQLRLRFVTDDNDDLSADYIAFVSGNATSNRPQLIITYSLP